MMPGITRKELHIISVVPDTDTKISLDLYHFTLDILSYSLPYPVTSFLMLVSSAGHYRNPYMTTPMLPMNTMYHYHE